MLKKSVVTCLKNKILSGNFLEICDTENDRFAFGGNQAWFSGSRNTKGIKRSDFGSCGVIAAANVLCYLEKREEKLTQLNYLEIANSIYDSYLRPLDFNRIALFRVFGINRFSFGIWPISKFEKGLTRFSRQVLKRNISHTAISNNDIYENASLARARDFIKESLAGDKPVVILLSYNPSARQKGSTDRHYMVITMLEEIYDGDKLQDLKVTVSSWGEENEISFSVIWNDSIFAKTGHVLKKNPFTFKIGNWINNNICSVYLVSFSFY